MSGSPPRVQFPSQVPESTPQLGERGLRGRHQWPKRCHIRTRGKRFGLYKPSQVEKFTLEASASTLNMRLPIILSFAGSFAVGNAHFLLNYPLTRGFDENLVGIMVHVRF